MIEINLLPDDLKPHEHTPPARLLLYGGLVMVILAMAGMLGYYHLYQIPRIENEIKTRNAEIAVEKVKEKEVDTVNAEIKTLNQKANVFDNLTNSRVRYARVLDRLANTMPEGVWLKNFSVANDGTAAPGGAAAAAMGGTPGKRYVITASGFLTGKDEQEQQLKLSEMNRLMKENFNILPPQQVKLGEQPDKTYGFDPKLGLRFSRLDIESSSQVPIPQPSGAEFTQKRLDQLKLPKAGADFSLKVRFETLPRKPAM